MQKAVRTKDRNLRIENEFYTITLERRKGGAVGQYITKKSGDTTLHREGCEIWDRNWGPFHPFHYQQERSVMIDDFAIEKNKATIQAKVKSQLGQHLGHGPERKIHDPCGWCTNNWIFQVGNLAILCDFKIGHDGRENVESAKFKKYACFAPNLYTHWACKKGDEIVSGIIDKSKETQIVVYSPPPQWITFFNAGSGVALFLPDMSLWSEVSYGHIWRSGMMTELLYACDCKRDTFSSSIGYLAYPTTQDKKWRAIEEWLL